MIRTLRVYFFRRHLREKVLIVALVLLVALLWLSNLGGRAGRFFTDGRETSMKLAEQKQWLAHRTAIQQNAAKAAAIFDPSRTLDSTQLLAAVNAIAHDAGLNSTTSTEAQDVSSGQFAVHSLQFNISRADWNSLKTFYVALQQRAPYIGVEQFQLARDRANPFLHNVNMKISSVEVVRNSP